MKKSTIQEIEQFYGVSIDNFPKIIDAYDKKTGDLIKDTPIKISLNELQKIFGLSEDNPMTEPYEIFPDQAKELEKYIPERIELDKYDYYLYIFAPEKKENHA